MKNRVISVILLLAMSFTAICGLSGCDSGGGQDQGKTGVSKTDGAKQDNSLSGETIKIEPEQMKVTSKGGVEVDFGVSFEEGTEITIKQIRPEPVDGDVEIYAYDFSASSGQPDGVVEIAIPYDPSGLSEEEEALSVCGKYFNAESGSWEDVFYSVDAAENKVRILTDHFSTYSAFKIKNPGKRNEYISEVNAFVGFMTTPQAENILKKYVKKEANWQEDLVGSFLDATGSWDYFFASNATTLITLGGVYDDLISKSFQDRMSELGVATACVQVMFDIYRHGPVSREVVSSTINLFTTIAVNKASPRMQLAYLGYAMVEMAINDVKTYAIETKYESTKNMYDAYYARTENKRRASEWRLIFTKIYKAHLSEPEVAIQKMKEEIDAYVDKFWEVSATDWDSWIDSYDKNATLAKYPWPTREDQVKISSEHKANLHSYLQPVFRIIQREMYYECMNEREKEYKKVAAMMNTVYTVNIAEDYEGEPKWANAFVRMSPLSDKTAPEDWTVQLDKEGRGQMKFTMLAHIRAGFPMVLDIYKNEEELKGGKPSTSVDLKRIEGKQMEVVLRTKPEEKIDFAGTFEGTLTSTSTGHVQKITTVITLEEKYDDGGMYNIVCTGHDEGKKYIDSTYFIRDRTGEANIAGVVFKFSEDRMSFQADMMAHLKEPWGIMKCQRVEK